jgi:hypothetical protein
VSREAPKGGADDAAVSHREERVDEQEDESFPASDPHSDWAGPGSVAGDASDGN